jgi:hypothetical protein
MIVMAPILIVWRHYHGTLKIVDNDYRLDFYFVIPSKLNAAQSSNLSAL